MNSSGPSSSCTAPVEGWVLDGAMYIHVHKDNCVKKGLTRH